MNTFIPEGYRPAFSANPIELNMHRIPGLAERFVFFNDDMFLLAPMAEADFFKNAEHENDGKNEKSFH